MVLTVGELVTRLRKWPQDCAVVTDDGLDNFYQISDVNYWAAYDQGYVVICGDGQPVPDGGRAPVTAPGGP